ncbi:SGNH/GDSL hydrolase family protein [Actinoplanes sp. KI2]|uniref:SGNH/GDSL hydrolase family protein n=1 Tax=Actinoplanes sp. KI2 TaxID=2983315 RepID=UPI0021D5F052|nr:SGNH/GDSL hydrolase family protein [Actinoplanes sp. KI2]MCU7723054.1 SGNH/GDSL hydrolase family protein [Actinoplanes sp. KI2]
MMRGGLAAVLVAVLAGGVLSGCGRAAPPTSSPGSASGAAALPRSIVALGDSVPRGTNCDCTPYPPLTAGDLGTTIGSEVSATNDSVAGYTTDGVLRQLDKDESVIKHVGGADVVEIEVGANDVAHTGSCGTDLSCYTDEIPQVEKNLTTIVARVHELTGGAHVVVVLLDYWSVWLGGSYAAAEGEAYVATAQELTDEINAAIKSVATASGSVYVDLRAAFKGPDYAYDETHYLSDDGDHPNAAGHRQIADATAAAVATTLHLTR